MEKFLSFDNHMLIRTVPLGMFVVGAIFTLAQTHSIALDLNIYANTSLMIFGVFLGFFLDFLGLYKFHPVYRLIRRKFFLEVFGIVELKRMHKDKTDSEKIQLAEHMREEILVAIDVKRSEMLRVEHAIWILMYNVSSVSTILLVVFLLFWYTEIVPTSNETLVVTTLLLVILFTLISAVMRTRSYDEKLKHAIKKHRAH